MQSLSKGGKNGGAWARTPAMAAATLLASLGMLISTATAQTAPQPVLPELVQQAQTVHIPINVMDRASVLPVRNLQPADLTLDVDGKPRAFQISRPWSRSIDPKTGQPEDRPNLLIILPLASPLPRKDALEQAIQDLKTQADRGWNISILDDSGDQTPYTHNMKTTIADLEKIQSENPSDEDLDSWRRTASLAIASMRELPGRRVVMALGDIFHEMVFDYGQLVYQNFDIHDLALAARDAGAVIYCAESSQEIEGLRRLAPYYLVLGSGPWLILSRDGHVGGWTVDTVSDAMKKIAQYGDGSYDLDVHLNRKEMNGHPHAVSITARHSNLILSVPLYFVSPDLAQLQLLSRLAPGLRQALKTPPPAASSPLQLVTQLNYFPHADGKTGTQLATTGFFWNNNSSPPRHLETALELAQTNIGYVAATAASRIDWTALEPVWNQTLEVGPGAYQLRVAAVGDSGKVAAGSVTPFTVDPATGESVLISSLVLGKSCVFAPLPPQSIKPPTVDYLRAGNCDLRPSVRQYYSPQDVIWTLVRVTPIAKLADRPAKNWKASFLIIDAKGSKVAEEKVHWLPASDGGFVATSAFALGNPKLKLVDGEYAVVFQMRGPGIDGNYAEDAPFMVYGAEQPR